MTVAATDDLAMEPACFIPPSPSYVMLSDVAGDLDITVHDARRLIHELAQNHGIIVNVWRAGHGKGAAASIPREMWPDVSTILNDWWTRTQQGGEQDA